MDCNKCGEQITGERYGPDVIVLDSFHPDLYRQPKNVRHPHCVDDPIRLDEHNFHKWAVATINAELQRRLAFEQNVQKELEIIHRALHALPTHLNQTYIDEIYSPTSPERTPSSPVTNDDRPSSHTPPP